MLASGRTLAGTRRRRCNAPQCNYLLCLVAQLKLGSPQVSRDPIFARVAVQKLYPFAGKVQMMPSGLDSHCSCLFRDPWAASLFLTISVGI